MLIEVTQEDIDQGCKEDANNCPVARAMSRAFPGTTVQVDGTHLSVTWADQSWRGWPTTTTVASFIERFDHGDPVEPFSFDLWLQEAAA